MKRLFSAIAAAFRSSVSFIWTRCKETGKLIMTTVASIGAGSSAPAGPVVEEVPAEYGTAADLIPADDGSVDRLIKRSQALLDTLGLVPPSPGDNYDRIKRICTDVAEGGWGDPWDIAKLSGQQAEWLELMTPAMHKLVGDASREDLIAHMKGGKGIRGVIRADKESVAEWKRSNEMEDARAAYDIETLAMEGEPEWAQGRLAAC